MYFLACPGVNSDVVPFLRDLRALCRMSNNNIIFRRMKAYRHALACISASKKSAVNFIRWDRHGRWRNNPARVLKIFEKISVDADVDYYGMDQDYRDCVRHYHYYNDKFPRSYFDVCWLPDAKRVTSYLRERQLIRERDEADCEAELLKSLVVSLKRRSASCFAWFCVAC